jgi:hypothetical protein
VTELCGSSVMICIQPEVEVRCVLKLARWARYVVVWLCIWPGPQIKITEIVIRRVHMQSHGRCPWICEVRNNRWCLQSEREDREGYISSSHLGLIRCLTLSSRKVSTI